MEMTLIEEGRRIEENFPTAFDLKLERRLI